ncbi:Na+/H+ antiporter subunit G [Aquincola sp. MAHUQ-54]|uniref:Na+/H+ antiporter subunit G n=1 Tax=Aquincola agrisoli TaxID=3119538 RepID=A0AAW9QGU1_9BURK
MNALPWWIEWPVAVLLVTGGVLALAGALGLLRLQDFFDRLHPPALAITLGSWCVSLASVLYFSALESRPVLAAWLIPILLSITAPITSLLLARAARFRRRDADAARAPMVPGP